MARIAYWQVVTTELYGVSTKITINGGHQNKLHWLLHGNVDLNAILHFTNVKSNVDNGDLDKSLLELNKTE